MDTRNTTDNGKVLFLAARLFLAFAAALALSYPLSPALARDRHLAPEVFQVFVDDDYDESTLGWGVDHFDTIQAGVDAVEEGGFVLVGPGLYVESVLITKPLTLSGAQSGVNPVDTNGADRPGGESILRPPVFEPFFANLITIHASHVTVDGFLLDGNNPDLGNVGDLANGIRLHVGGGVANGTVGDAYVHTVSNMRIANNIFKNINLYGVTISSSAKTPASNHVIEKNFFDNIVGGDTPYGSRRAMRMARNQYAVVANNVAKRVQVGIEVTTFDRQNPGAPASITNNDFESVRDGIWINQFVGATSPILIDGNTLRTAAVTPVINSGITINVVRDAAQLQFYNNTVVSGAVYGMQVYSLSAIAPLRLLNFTVQSPSENGVLISNKRGSVLSSGNARILMDGVNISGGKIGVNLLDEISRPVTSTLTLTMTNDSQIVGSLIGIRANGAGATLNLLGNDSAGISNNTTGIYANRSVRLNAVGNRIDANQIGVVISGTLNVTAVSQNWITNNTSYGIVMTGTLAGGSAIINNDLTGNGTAGAWNNTAGTANMYGNHWGSASPGAVAGKVLGNVDYSPWLNTATDTSANAGFQGDFSLLSVDDLATEVSANALQEGVDLALAPGTVNVASGSYPTGVTLNKNIDLRMSGNVTIAGAVAQNQGTLTAAPSSLILLGDLLRFGGTFNANGGTVHLLGTVPQRLGGVSATTFNNLEIDNLAGVELAGSARVDGTLTLGGSLLNVKTYHLTLGAAATIAGDPLGSGNMFVTDEGGAVCKVFTGPGSFTFPVGDTTGTANYTPATIAFTSGTFSDASACVGVVDARYPLNFAVNHLTRYWSLAANGISSYSANLTFNYASDLEDVAGDESALKELGFTGTTLSYQGDPVNTATNSMAITTGEINGVAFTAGNSPPAVTITALSVTRLGPTSARINWTVSAEANINGYHVWRSTSLTGTRTRVNPALIPPGGPGHSYQVTDNGITPGASYYYWLEVDSIDNNDYMIGPFILQWHTIFAPILLK